jgi:hypothetical protein
MAKPPAQSTFKHSIQKSTKDLYSTFVLFYVGPVYQPME